MARANFVASSNFNLMYFPVHWRHWNAAMHTRIERRPLKEEEKKVAGEEQQS